MLNKVLHHVVMSWIIETNLHLEYDIDKHNPDWITCGPWYNTSTCKKIHGIAFEKYIINARNDRYKLFCSIDAYEKQ